LKDFFWFKFLQVLKTWSRIGLLRISQTTLNEYDCPKVLSVGGYGPVDDFLGPYVAQRLGIYTTFDIDQKHSPDFLGDVCMVAEFVPQKVFDVVIALEVLEHVSNPGLAINGIHKVLRNEGVFIFSTPWIIPIHDRPSDYYRLTPAALQMLCKEFSSVKIFARGNYYDSVVVLLLRGLFMRGAAPRIFLVIGTLLAVFSRKPKIHDNLDKIDSTIGYVVVAHK
jgi:hypothetical protein